MISPRPLHAAQPVATHGNGFPKLSRSHHRLIATGCQRLRPLRSMIAPRLGRLFDNAVGPDRG